MSNSPIKFEISDIFGVGRLASSPAVVRLIDGIASGVGRIYEDVMGPPLLKRRSKAELDVALRAIASLPNRENLLMDVGGRATLRIQRDAAIRQHNRENIVVEAIQIASEEFPTNSLEDSRGQEIDESWLRAFWDTSETVSDEQLQSMWGRILVRKSLLPSELNIRVLQRMALLSSVEVQDILKLAEFATRFISPDPDFPNCYGVISSLGQYQGTFTVNEDKGNLGDLIERNLFPIDRGGLDSAGIMQASNGWASEFGVPYSSNIALNIGNKAFILENLPAPNERFKKFYHFGSGYGLTREGWEIARIANYPPNTEYVARLSQAIETAGCRLIEQT